MVPQNNCNLKHSTMTWRKNQGFINSRGYKGLGENLAWAQHSSGPPAKDGKVRILALNTVLFLGDDMWALYSILTRTLVS